MRLDDGHGYILGNSDAEHERLIRQAKRLAPVTENFFREAGIGPGQRVLDLGSGVGDVAMLAAHLVGPSGEVVAIERDARSVNRARARAAEAGLHNVIFVETEIAHFASNSFFDAAVGRYILQFLSDPVATLRSVAGKVQDAGLPKPDMRLVMDLGHDREFIQLLSDAVMSGLCPHAEKLNLSLDELGDLSTLQRRLEDEVSSSNTIVPWIALVGAWCRTPTN